MKKNYSLSFSFSAIINILFLISIAKLLIMPMQIVEESTEKIEVGLVNLVKAKPIETKKIIKKIPVKNTIKKVEVKPQKIEIKIPLNKNIKISTPVLSINNTKKDLTHLNISLEENLKENRNITREEVNIKDEIKSTIKEIDNKIIDERRELDIKENEKDFYKSEALNDKNIISKIVKEEKNTINLPSNIEMKLITGEGEAKWNPSNKEPVYPLIARQNSWEGKVSLRLKVDKKGRVFVESVDKSGANKALYDAVLEVADTWEINIKKNGVPLEGIVEVTYKFELKK